MISFLVTCRDVPPESTNEAVLTGLGKQLDAAGINWSYVRNMSIELVLKYETDGSVDNPSGWVFEAKVSTSDSL